MRALVKTRAEPGLWLEDVPEPEHGINDVLIRVRRTGICGTDVHIERWDPWAQRTIPVPLVIGHEFVGEVVEVGSNVTDFHPGDWSAARATWSAAAAATAWRGGGICARTRRASE
jgi:threonine 3-dehydrogenase